jgi:hypothetical protein
MVKLKDKIMDRDYAAERKRAQVIVDRSYQNKRRRRKSIKIVQDVITKQDGLAKIIYGKNSYLYFNEEESQYVFGRTG